MEAVYGIRPDPAGPPRPAGGDGPLHTPEDTSEAFRAFMSAYYTGVTVVTSIDDAGRPHGLTCNSLTSVTLSPPTLLVCLGRGSGTLAAARARAGFAVNLLHDRGRPAAELFSSAAPDRFDRAAWRRSARMGLPWLVEDAHAMVECRVAGTVPISDHEILLGRVVNVEGDAGRGPLLYGRRRFLAGVPDRDQAGGGPPAG